nr:MAG TPA: hypothetical protein [Crassvirales sp.]
MFSLIGRACSHLNYLSPIHVDSKVLVVNFSIESGFNNPNPI